MIAREMGVRHISFQFHPGLIKRACHDSDKQRIERFQFHPGLIKSRHVITAEAIELGFNSTLV